MENFRKLNSEIVNNVINFGGALPRSLVLINTEKGAVYSVAAKCRTSNPLALAKCLAKVLLIVEKERVATNSTAAALASGKKVASPLNQAMSSDVIRLTDKDGKLIDGATLSLEGKVKLNGNRMTLRDVFRFTRTQEIYKLVVEQGKDWADENVARALTVWCEAAIEQMDWLDRVDTAIGVTADATEKEEKAAEKAAKEAAKKAA